MTAEKEGIGTTNLKNVKVNSTLMGFKKHFHIKKTKLDIASQVFFNSDIASRIVMGSPLTPLLYKVGSKLRTSDESELVSQMAKTKNHDLF